MVWNFSNRQWLFGWNLLPQPLNPICTESYFEVYFQIPNDLNLFFDSGLFVASIDEKNLF